VADAASADGLAQQTILEGHLGEICTIKFSPSGEFMASGDALNKILIWKGTELAHEWSMHTARVSCLDWLPGSTRLVSGSLDRHLVIWDLEGKEKKIKVEEAHKGGVQGLTACGAGKFASAGFDGFVHVYELA